MKITPTTRTITLSRRPGTNGAKGADAGEPFARHLEEKPAASAAQATTPLNALGGVLAVQEVAASGGGGRAVSYGHRLLDELHELRLAMIDGWLPERSLRRLAGLVGQARGEVDDPRLAGVLDEIEVRAAVEAAKLERERS